MVTEFQQCLHKISIVAKGPSWYRRPKQWPDDEEVWLVKTMYKDVPNGNRIFFLDDPRYTILKEDAEVTKHLNELEAPVYFVWPNPHVKNAVRYPLDDVLHHYGFSFFMDIVGHMMSLAIMQKPKMIDLYGCDYQLSEDLQPYQREIHNVCKGCTEFWVGYAMGLGIKVFIPPESALMKREGMGVRYGYEPRMTPEGLIQNIKGDKIAGQYELVPIGEELPMG